VNVPRPDLPAPGPPHPDPERLVLAALPAEPADPAVVAHLRDCARCRSEVADLRRTVELAREAGVADTLPPPPRRVWEGVAAELGLPGERNGQVDGILGVAPERPDGEPDERAPGGDRDASLEPRPGDGPDPDRATALPAVAGTTRRGRRVLVPLVAAAIGLGAGIGVGHVVAPAPSATPVGGPVGRLAPVGGLDPGASGTVAMADARGEREMVVQVRGVTNLAGGDHLEAWLMDPTGTRLVPLGPLDGTGGDFHGTFALPAGVPLGEFDRIDVSTERWDGNPGHSTLSVLRGGCCP
jgi:hypothetical protein